MAMRAALPFLALLFAAFPAKAQGLRFDENTVGAPRSGKPVELYLPAAGIAPTAGVVVQHGCNGVGPHDRDWAARLAQWGYAALLVDSFTPRGIVEVCNRGRLVPAALRARDAFDGAAYLRSRTDLGIRSIGLIGFSHGGGSVLKAVQAGVARTAGEPPLSAAVAYYPGCEAAVGPLETDTLIMMGDADDWSSAARCERWRETIAAGGHVLDMKIYPGALHGFDALAPPHLFAGHRVGQDPAARADSIARTQAFFAARLAPAP